MNLGSKIDLNGVIIFANALDRAEQEALVEDLRTIAQAAPFFSPITARGKPMSVRMTSAGQFGWISDSKGYRYERKHPSGRSWPQIPERLLQIWAAVAPAARAPESALINYYGQSAKMGLHQDADEADMSQPVVSLSLGDEALFRVGGHTRSSKTASHWLCSGDVAVLSGDARLAFHGIDRVKHGSSTLLPKGGRINVTMRVVT